MAYPAMGMKNAESQCLVRYEVYEHLLSAAPKLPEGIKFKIWDAWRPFSLQQELFEVYSAKIEQTFDLSSFTENEREEFISRFVSVPLNDTSHLPVHTTGGAIDLTLIDMYGNELDMGTAFDEFTEKTHTAFFEASDNDQVRVNRRMLYRIMTEGGFTNLPSEWWHYDYGNRFWAYYNNVPAIYRGVFEKDHIDLL